MEEWETTVDELAGMMLDLAERGAHNIELVSATSQVAFWLPALCAATARGMHLPVVYNTSGFERLEVLHLLDGVVDVYLPDLKYASSHWAGRLSAAADYPSIAFRAVAEMWRQVGPLQLDAGGMALRGLLVRHLVLPAGLSQTAQVLGTLRRQLGPRLAVSLMAQYHPPAHQVEVPPLMRKLRAEEYRRALDLLEHLGIDEGFVQERTAAANYLPDFDRGGHPFEGG